MRERGWLWGGEVVVGGGGLLAHAHPAFQLSCLHGLRNLPLAGPRSTSLLGLGSFHCRPLFPSLPALSCLQSLRAGFVFAELFLFLPLYPAPLEYFSREPVVTAKILDLEKNPSFKASCFLMSYSEKSIQLGVRGHGIQLVCSSSQIVGSLWRRRVGLPDSCSSR